MDIRVLLCLHILPTIHSSDMLQWQMLMKCGQTIGQDVFSGEVTASYLYSTRQVECQLVISPKQTSDVDNRVLFYFTDIHLESSGRPCEAANITIQEAESPFSPSSGITVPGIRGTLCGDNDTLVDLVLTTRYYSNLVITMKRSSHWHSTSSSFTLKFVSFYEGPCDDSTFTCSNERCIDTSLKCSDDVNACGDGSHCPSLDFWDNIKNTFEENAKWIYIALGLLVGYYVVKELYKRFRNDNCLKKSHSGGNSNRSDSPSRRGRLTSLEGRRISCPSDDFALELSERRPSSASSVSEASVNIGMTTSENPPPVASSNYAPPDYQEFAPINSDVAGEDTPRAAPNAPPDYDFTPISEEEMRSAPPSYEDVIANEDIYKTSNA